ncbi:MAG TPA: dihydrofolate reductase family protein [Polyangiaceae bacterium]|jgi:dihydrofolate reductase|nr:dihydrofolate reductase family protein [Polyangiaceae bacterium]
MRKLILKMSMSLDGFVVGPDGKQDWIFRSSDKGSNGWELELICHAGLHAMGSFTYREMATYWPWSTEVFAEPMNAIPKVVFSHRSLAELTRDVDGPAPALKDARKAQPTAAVLESWRNPRVLSGELSAELRRLKEEPGKDIVLYGGASLAQNVVKTGLVDEYFILTHPIALGRGLPLFSSLEEPVDLELDYARAFETGAVAHLYRPKKR